MSEAHTDGCRTPIGLRDFLDAVRDLGELQRVTGADWDREMSAISELTYRGDRAPKPALVFDDIPGYPAGYRTLYGTTNSLNRLALTIGLTPGFDDEIDFIRQYREMADDIEHGAVEEPARLDPADAPVMTTTLTGGDIDLTAFPVPLHHEHDGGRYIGTGNCVITRDREDGRINVGTYRMQLFDERSTGLYISPGKHGRLAVEGYFEAGERVPIAATLGQDPTLWMFSSMGLKHDSSYGEYARAGGLKGRPYPVVEGPETGLPVPANAEIVLEGYLEPGHERVEGPFGEWTGYYGSGASESPVLDVRAVHHRDDPILVCAVPGKPPYDYSYHKSVVRSANLWDQVEDAGVPNVEGVWRTEAGGSRLFNVIAITQRYAGHARQAAYVAAQVQAGAYAGRWTIVVDEDIDPSNLDEVTWAMSTRVDPVSDIETIDRAWSTPLDPMVPEAEKAHPFNSRAIIDATIPYERRDEFPRVAEVDPDYRTEVENAWRDVIEGTR